MMKCPAPKAPDSLKDQMRQKRRKRDTGCNCVVSEIIVNLDGVQAKFNLTYYNDPSLDSIDTRVFETNDQKLTLNVSKSEIYKIDYLCGFKTLQNCGFIGY